MNPKVHESAYIAPSAVIVGDVRVAEGVSVWDGAVLRGDVSYIVVGKNSNIQDNVVVHVSHGVPTVIGENVTVGHLAMVHAATIHDNVIVGIHAVVLDGAEIGEGSVIGAGSVVTPGTKIPPNSLVLGIPGKVVRQGPDVKEMAVKNGLVYQQLRDEHLAGKYGRYRQ
ncbi:MAG: gamma carbonic anhydrase family protein [Euryarchaeota archaeon]|nr:gamma carbonic anhydrase family protein [Euryarchaeota archaeon]